MKGSDIEKLIIISNRAAINERINLVKQHVVNAFRVSNVV